MRSNGGAAVRSWSAAQRRPSRSDVQTYPFFTSFKALCASFKALCANPLPFFRMRKHTSLQARCATQHHSNCTETRFFLVRVLFFLLGVRLKETSLIRVWSKCTNVFQLQGPVRRSVSVCESIQAYRPGVPTSTIRIVQKHVFVFFHIRVLLFFLLE